MSASSSWAISSTILFSKPSSRSFEKGRLLGSAHTRSSRACAAPMSAKIANAMRTLREAEDIERSSLVRCLLEVSHCVDEAERGGAIARVKVTGNDRTGPATDSGQYRDILVAVRPAIGDRLADDSRAGLELPKQFAGLGMYRFEPAFHRAVEHDVSG